MPKIKFRRQRIADAKRFFEILYNPNFKYWPIKPKSVRAETEWLRGNKEKRKKNIEHNFAILFSGKVVGAAGIKVDQARPYIGEIGYFIDEEYWDKGLATMAVKKLEKMGFGQLGMVRIEIRIDPRNKASKRVAEKCGYKKEGALKKCFKASRNHYIDNLLYAKVR